MSFASPVWLLGLALVPAVVAAYVLLDRRRRLSASVFATPALLPNVLERRPGRRRHLPLAVMLLALVAMIVGVARPHATLSVPREEATVILAIDVSRSMSADDVNPTRLDAARRAAATFMQQVPKKFRIGIISFASSAVVALPPTADRQLTTEALRTLRRGEGTALGDAVALAVRMGQRQRAKDGAVPPTAVLLISDGARDGGRTTPQAAAQKAKAAHVPVYTVVLGTQDGVVEVPLQGGYTQVIRVPPRPATLQQIARTTGGQFFTATDDTRLRAVYQGLGSRLGHRKESREITDVFAAGSAGLLLVGGALSLLWFRRIP